jgi:N-acyl-D-amino-acid deacylase
MMPNQSVTRRAFFTISAAGMAGIARAAESTMPVTGVANSHLEPLDKLMTSFVEEQKVPGASFAVARQGKLVFARGFGYADVEKKEPVRPDSLFRIASVSKPITAVAVMRLIEKGKLGLDDKVTDRMHLEPFLADGAKLDPRWKQITIRHCLQHRGGWDRNKSFDPIGRAWDIAKALKIQPPVRPVHVVRWMMGRPLDFDPGERMAYSNLGYLVLGRIIEAATGRKYEEFVHKEILTPLGIKAMKLGRALIENRDKDEVHYYDAKKRMGPALYPPRLGQRVPAPYGADNFEAYEAHGGWIASAVDLVKFASAFDNPERCPILGRKQIREMWDRPAGLAGNDRDGKPKATYYGCGWSVCPVGSPGRSNNWHTGYIGGSEALLVRRWDGLNWAVLFNTNGAGPGKSLASSIDAKIHEAVDAVKRWPGQDQFDKLLK